MEALVALSIIVGVLVLLYLLGRQTLIDWSHENDPEPSPKEVILFTILFIIVQKSLTDSFKNKNNK